MNNLKKVQSLLKNSNVHAFIFPRTDEFLSEYIAPYAERVKWISNFSGSSGKIIVMQKKAVVFVDGRYTIQAKKEINLNYFSIEHISTFYKWLQNNLKKNFTVGLDPNHHSKNDIELIKKITDKKNIKIVFFEKNPVDQVWKNRPIRPTSKVFQHKLKYSGKSVKEKLSEIQSIILSKKCDYYILNALDSIAWLLNLRGNDILYTPLNFAYVIITKNKKIELFIDEKKIQNLKKQLNLFSNLHPLLSVKSFLKNLKPKTTIGIDKIRTPIVFEEICLKNNLNITYIQDPCIDLKAQKNDNEIQGARRANIRDSISVTKFLFWLKNIMKINKTDEIKAAKKLFDLRKKNDLFYSSSFETISAIDNHAALPHYRVDTKSNLSFKKNSIYLFDSGAQYLDGTTDITRTITIGKPSKEHKDRFTRVLKGHIAIATCIYKQGTKGSSLDSLARKSLQKIGCDYDHGTGHGVGSFLSVHEGPQRIAKYTESEIKEGMIVSNEPGYYKKGNYGIRIENLLITKKKSRTHLFFETISWAPIDIELIEVSLLNLQELKWINWYHKEVFNKISKKLNVKETLWLKKITRTIKK